MGHKLIPESELEKNQLVMADGHACLGEMLLFLGESEEARKNLEIALRGYKDHSGPENILLDKANMLHFLGEAYRNRYSRFSHNTVISPQHLRCLISYCNVTPFWRSEGFSTDSWLQTAGFLLGTDRSHTHSSICIILHIRYYSASFIDC